MADSLSIIDSDRDPSVLTSDFTELTENPETGPVQRRIQSTNPSSPDKPDRKKRRLNEELWSHTRPPKNNEPVRNQHHQEIYYCKYCKIYKGTSASVRFREHLRDKHSIRVSLTEDSTSRTAFKNTLEDLFGKQAER